VLLGNVKGAERLKAYVDNGGGLLLFPSSDAGTEGWNELLKVLPLPAASGAAGKKGDAAVVNRFSNIDYDHPLFQNIFLNEDKRKIESPEIYYSLNIRPSGKGRDIITLSDGSVFMGVYSHGRRKDNQLQFGACFRME
jgi:hypothetical protein